MKFRCLATASALVWAGAAACLAEPRSAIPWLSESLRTVSVAEPPPESGELPAPPAPAPAKPDAVIEASALEPRSLDGTGMLSPGVSGLPADLWGPTSELRARSLINRVAASGVPAAQELYRTLLLASTWPPAGARTEASLLRSRIDRLMAMGALEEALEVLNRAGLETPEFLQRRFDIALLTGQAEAACDGLLARRDVTPTAAARIFCLARTNAWTDAVVTLAVARESGDLTPAEDAIFSRFLGVQDPVPGESLAVPDPLTPLNYLMLKAIGAGGDAVADSELPAAFSTLDLAGSAPPRARILAAERLVASGGAAFPILFYAYRSDRPAASGGVWSRAAAVQALDAALAAADPEGIARDLPVADGLLAEIGLRVAFAREYAPGLARVPVRPELEPERMAALLLLGGETAASRSWISATSPLRYQVAADVAAGVRRDPKARAGSMEDAVARAFAREVPDQSLYGELAALLSERRVGEALLRALVILDARDGVEPADLTAALRIIAEAGQKDTAARIAVEVLLMFEDG